MTIVDFLGIVLLVVFLGVPLVGLSWLVLRKLFRWALRSYRKRAFERAQLSARIAQTWQLATRRLEGAKIAGGGISVRADGVELRIEPVENPDGVRIVASGACGIPPELTIRTRREAVLETEQVDADDVTTGDSDFDARLRLRGNAPLLMALLDVNLRRHLAHHAENDDIRVDAGGISWLSHGIALSSSDLLRRVDRVRDLAKQVREATSDIPGKLATNVTKDPVPGVRAASLRVLNETFPGTLEAREATTRALTGPDPEVRIVAASYSGAEGLAVLSRLATWGRRVVSRVSTQALRRLVESAPRPTAIRMIDDLLERAAGRRLQAAVAECGRIRHRAAIPKLIGFLRARNPALAAEAARALAEFGDRSVEPALIAALQPDRAELAVAVAEALGRVGTVSAAEALRELGADPGASDGVRAAAAAAVRAIQDRLDIDRGQLVISDTTVSAGELSLAEGAKGGEVSVVDSRPLQTKEAERIES